MWANEHHLDEPMPRPRRSAPAEASSQDMKAAMKEALEGAGVLEPVRAHLRAVIFQALSGSSPESQSRPQPSAESLIVHELFREYLAFAGLEHTLAVFEVEAGIPAAPVPRRLMADRVGLGGAPANVPLIYGMLAECARLNEETDP